MTPDLPPLREVIARHGLAASKALGQNFLLDAQLLARIARIPGDLTDAEVLEIGPGPGGLTRALLAAGARVTAIERDRRCIPALAELGEAYPGRLRVIEDDALTVDARPLFEGRPHIASNLPYNIGTALLVRWLSAEWQPWWQSLTLMFQREVADRIVAHAGGDAYGRLAVLAQWRATAKLAMPVHRSAFTPPPKVMSAVVHITPNEAPEGVEVGIQFLAPVREDARLYRVGAALEALLEDDRVGTVLAGIIQAEPITCAIKYPPILAAVDGKALTKPLVFAGLDEGADVPADRIAALRAAGIPWFPTTERALRAIAPGAPAR